MNSYISDITATPFQVYLNFIALYVYKSMRSGVATISSVHQLDRVYQSWTSPVFVILVMLADSSDKQPRQNVSKSDNLNTDETETRRYYPNIVLQKWLYRAIFNKCFCLFNRLNDECYYFCGLYLESE